MSVVRVVLAVVVCALLASSVTASAAQPSTVHVQGAVRCMPDGGWVVLDDVAAGGVHQPVGGLAVESVTDREVWISYTPMARVHTMIVDEDETLSAQGVLVGASADVGRARLVFRGPSGVLDPSPCTAVTTRWGNVWVDGTGSSAVVLP